MLDYLIKYTHLLITSLQIFVLIAYTFISLPSLSLELCTRLHIMLEVYYEEQRIRKQCNMNTVFNIIHIITRMIHQLCELVLNNVRLLWKVRITCNMTHVQVCNIICASELWFVGISSHQILSSDNESECSCSAKKKKTTRIRRLAGGEQVWFYDNYDNHSRLTQKWKQSWIRGTVTEFRRWLIRSRAKLTKCVRSSSPAISFPSRRGALFWGSVTSQNRQCDPRVVERISIRCAL